MRKKKVLIMDDEVNLVRLTKLNLEKTGNYEVETMTEVTDILSSVKSFKPDVIILDILMPGMGGAEACALLKEDPASKLIPIMTLSALDTDEEKRVMKGLGVVDFIVKPVEVEDLVSRIERVLNENPGR